MSHFWSNHPELYDEITINHLPEEWKEKVENGMDLYEVPEDIRFKAAMEGEREYWAGLVDRMRMEKK